MHIEDLGLIDYRQALDIQKRLHSMVRCGAYSRAAVVCSHYPVITLGRSSKNGSLLFGPDHYQKKGIAVVPVERGGDATYHGPGQLTVYPVFDLRACGLGLHSYLRLLEGSVINALDLAGVKAGRRDGLTGVWHVNDKLCSIGIAVKNWVTYHGLSINIRKDDLGNFSLIKPCGMDIRATSVETILGTRVDMDDIKNKLIRSLEYDTGDLAVAR